MSFITSGSHALLWLGYGHSGVGVLLSTNGNVVGIGNVFYSRLFSCIFAWPSLGQGHSGVETEGCWKDEESELEGVKGI